MMHYTNIKKALFKSRPNRFIAYGELEGKSEIIHVKNTGRCKELLLPEANIYIQQAENPKRKTKWDLIAVEKGDRLINIDSQAPNIVVRELIERGGFLTDKKLPSLVKAEAVHGDSRFDFYLEQGNRKIFIEVKGVTLEKNGVALFPDAPSERALKHVNGLIEAVEQGYEAYIIFVIQMEKVNYFTPNQETQAEFCSALKKAKEVGVKLLAYDCKVTSNQLLINQEVRIVL